MQSLKHVGGLEWSLETYPLIDHWMKYISVLSGFCFDQNALASRVQNPYIMNVPRWVDILLICLELLTTFSAGAHHQENPSMNKFESRYNLVT